MLRNLKVAALAVLLAYANPGTGLAADLQKITISTSGEGLHYFPVYIARGGGFFAEEGLEADWVSVGSGTRQAASVMGGSADMTPLALFHVIKSAREGANMVAFANIYDTYAVPLVLSKAAIAKVGIAPDQSVDERIQRLKGLKIGITSPGSSTDLMVRSMLQQRGINPDSFLTLQPFGNGSALLAAFEKNLSDGFAYPAPWAEIALGKGLGELVIDPFHKDLPELIDVPYVVMATSEDIIRTKPAMVGAATRALAKAIAFSKANPAGAKEIMRKYFPNIEPGVFDMVIERSLSGLPADVTITQDQVNRTAAWMNIGNPSPAPVEFSKVVQMPGAQRR